MKQEGLYQNKVNSRLASIHNCKMAYSKLKSKTILINKSQPLMKSLCSKTLLD